jgi:hypothetical protein
MGKVRDSDGCVGTINFASLGCKHKRVIALWKYLDDCVNGGLPRFIVPMPVIADNMRNSVSVPSSCMSVSRFRTLRATMGILFADPQKFPNQIKGAPEAAYVGITCALIVAVVCGKQTENLIEIVGIFRSSFIESELTNENASDIAACVLNKSGKFNGGDALAHFNHVLGPFLAHLESNDPAKSFSNLLPIVAASKTSMSSAHSIAFDNFAELTLLDKSLSVGSVWNSRSAPPSSKPSNQGAQGRVQASMGSTPSNKVAGGQANMSTPMGMSSPAGSPSAGGGGNQTLGDFGLGGM